MSSKGSSLDFEVVIIGAGFSGLLCAHYLKEHGVENFCVLDKQSAVGGVWSDGGVGAYPGAACDVPSYTYLPMLDRTGFIPSKKYVTQTEISAYAELLTDHLNLREKICLNREVIEVKYLGQGDKIWQVTTIDRAKGIGTDIISCQHIVTANGPLSSPRMPEFSGINDFSGESFHTAQWDQQASLAGKRVAVVGTGASAAQVIVEIADEVGSLHVFQRTPTWCLRRDDEPTPPEIKAKFEAGGYGESLRFVDYTGKIPPVDPLIEFDALHDPEKNAAICADLAAMIKFDVKDPELADRLTPDYPFFCKRALFIDDYYTTFNKPHVTLVDDSGGVVGVDATGLTIARGEHFEFDVIIYATGFDLNAFSFPVVGKNGVALAEKFGATEKNNHQMTQPKSLWGVHVEDMPNYYMMIGPQSLNPVTNVTLLCEQQAKYIADLVSKVRTRGHREVEPTPDAVSQWTALCDATAEGKVWLNCNNWYLKMTKTDVAAGRERSQGMWMDTYEHYLQNLLGAKNGSQAELLVFR